VKPLVVHPEAEAELQVAAGYYEERVAGLGSEFLEEIGDCFRRVEAAPGSWLSHIRSADQAIGEKGDVHRRAGWRLYRVIAFREAKTEMRSGRSS
jgi:hypothetical protein